MREPLATSPVGDELQPWQLVLASASPRRSQLLSAAGIPFTVVPAGGEEPVPGPADAADPDLFVERLARWKAEACPADIADGRTLVLAADTIVWHDGQILNKPADTDEARVMLRQLRGQSHQVFTGICLRSGERCLVGHEMTTVHFGRRSDAWIERYIATGEPMDKAGAYAAQGMGAFMIESIQGDYFNVVGLPLNRLGRMLEEFGVPVECWWRLNATPDRPA